jgi:FKBP-type peptidyl-prolyl cis-trans isomerase (trigger factor)
MPFASLKEVYGDDFITTIQQNAQEQRPNFQYKSLFNGSLDELENESENINKEIDSFVSDYSNGLETYNNSEPYQEEDNYEDLVEEYETESTKDINCGHLLEHLAKCPKCRLYLEKHFGKQENIQKYIQKKREDQFLDIAIYIVTGIFILFLLDIFVRLGKFMK